jgi:hypothetical protein
MDPFTLALALLAAMSEILPLLGCTRANGFLHAIKNLFIQFHAESDCHVDVDVATATQTPAASGGAAGPAS